LGITRVAGIGTASASIRAGKRIIALGGTGVAIVAISHSVGFISGRRGPFGCPDLGNSHAQSLLHDRKFTGVSHAGTGGGVVVGDMAAKHGQPNAARAGHAGIDLRTRIVPKNHRLWS